MKIERIVFLVVCAVGMMCPVSRAASYLETFDSGLNGFAIKDVSGGSGIYGAIESPADPAVGGASSIMRIENSFLPPPGGGDEDIIYLNLAGDFLDHEITFNFYASQAPGSLDAYFVGNGIVWLYSLGSAVSDWNTYFAAPIQYGGWYRWDAGAEDFATFQLSAQNITEVGIQLNYNLNAGGEVYGLDNFEVSVIIPEPETWAVLGFALISICIAFRKELDRSLVLALAMIKK